MCLACIATILSKLQGAMTSTAKYDLFCPPGTAILQFVKVFERGGLDASRESKQHHLTLTDTMFGCMTTKAFPVSEDTQSLENRGRLLLLQESSLNGTKIKHNMFAIELCISRPIFPQMRYIS
jgi:hypothetical protein